MKISSLLEKRIGFIVILSNIFNAMAVDIYLPALPAIQKNFHTSEYKTQLIIVVFYCGAVLSRLFWGPFSDVIGRRKAILIAYAIQSFFQLLCIYAPSIDYIIVFRVLQSLGSGVTGVIGTAIIADYYVGNERARMLGFVELSFIIAFVFAPAVGIVLYEGFGWQGGFFFIFISFLFSFFLFYYFLPNAAVEKKEKTQTPLEIFNVYKRNFNLQILRFSFISGISAGLFMGFALKAPFIYFSKFSVSHYEYIIFQVSPFIINLLISISYKKIIDRFSVDKTISFCIFSLSILSIFSFLIAAGIIIPNKHTYFFIMMYIAVFMPFLITGGVTLALDTITSKGTGSSISSSIRSLCLFLVMYSVSMLDSNERYIFYLIPILTSLLIASWVYAKKRLTLSSHLQKQRNKLN